MDQSDVVLRRAGGDDLAFARSLLSDNDLPTADLGDGPARLFVCLAEGERVGVGGVEQYGADALVRSVAVEPSARGEGVGTALCDALEETAREDGVETLYLLTTTAAGFFADRGYQGIEREAAPAAIQETTEFSSLCPDAAACMRKQL